MTYINNTLTQNSGSIVSPKIIIFSLLLRNPRSYQYKPYTPIDKHEDFNRYHDSFHLYYSNITSENDCPIINYKPYSTDPNVTFVDFQTYNKNKAGQFQTPGTITSEKMLSNQSDKNISSSYRFFGTGPNTNYNYCYLRLYTGGTADIANNNFVPAMNAGNPYRPSANVCKIPTIKLKSGFEYFIEVINNSNLILFDENNTKFSNSTNSSIHINQGQTYNPNMYATLFNTSQNVYDNLDITYNFSNYAELNTQWASKIIIYQIPISS